MIAANVISKEEYPDFDEETGILPKVDDEEGMMHFSWCRVLSQNLNHPFVSHWFPFEAYILLCDPMFISLSGK